MQVKKKVQSSNKIFIAKFHITNNIKAKENVSYTSKLNVSTTNSTLQIKFTIHQIDFSLKPAPTYLMS